MKSKKLIIFAGITLLIVIALICNGLSKNSDSTRRNDANDMESIRKVQETVIEDNVTVLEAIETYVGSKSQWYVNSMNEVCGYAESDGRSVEFCGIPNDETGQVDLVYLEVDGYCPEDRDEAYEMIEYLVDFCR